MIDQGERLDDNELIVKDVDSTSSNVYSVKILDDFDNALNITFSTMEVEHASITDPPSTLIFARKSRSFIITEKNNYILNSCLNNLCFYCKKRVDMILFR